MATSKKNQNTQIDKANKALVDLRPNVSTQDRSDAVTQLGLSGPTVQRYLNGRATNLDTALNMIQFFRTRIEKREKVLAA
jgi:hypothetical protein